MKCNARRSIELPGVYSGTVECQREAILFLKSNHAALFEDRDILIYKVHQDGTMPVCGNCFSDVFDGLERCGSKVIDAS